MFDPAWFTTRFDHASWSDVVVNGGGHGYYSNDDFPTYFHPDAKIIRPSTTGTSYCRARLCYGKNFMMHYWLRDVTLNLLILAILDEVPLMKLAGVGVVISEGCYASAGSLLQLSGSAVSIADCLLNCVVSINWILAIFTHVPRYYFIVTMFVILRCTLHRHAKW